MSKVKLEDLEYTSIINMYLASGQKEKADKMMILALDNYVDVRTDIKWLEEMELPSEIIKRYNNNPYILYLLAQNAVKPQKDVWEAVWAACSYTKIASLVKAGKMPVSYLELFVLRERNVEYVCETLFSFIRGTIKDLDWKKIAELFLTLDIDWKNNYYLKSIEGILLINDYDEEIHMEVAKRLAAECSSNRKCKQILKYVFDVHFGEWENDYENGFRKRPDLVYLLTNCRLQIKECDSLIIKAANAPEKLKEVSEDVAWNVFLFDIPGEERISILNYWARTGKIDAFDTYFSYFTSEVLDYEKVGSHLDEEFKNKQIKDEELIVGQARTRQNPEQVPEESEC